MVIIMSLPLSFSTDIPTSSFLHVNSCGALLLDDKDYFIDRPDGRSDYLLVYVARGIGHVTINNDEIVIGQKQAFLLKPQEPQSYRFYKKDNAVDYWVHFNGTQCDSIIKDLDLGGKHILRLNIDTLDIEQMLYRMCHEFTHKKPYYEQVCSGLLVATLSLISRSLSVAEEPASIKRSELIEQIISEFHTSPQYPLVISKFARKYSVSTNHLIREFKKSTGKSPSQYLIDIRIKKAEELLLFSNYTSSQIAEFLGYYNYSYFSRLFKKRVGVSPNEYRTRMMRK